MALSLVSGLGLAADRAVVLHNSNKLTLRVLPCDVVARVAPADQQNAAFEVEIAGRLAESGVPVVAPDRRVFTEKGFVVTLWAFHAPTSAQPPPDAYGRALHRLHTGMRAVDVPSPHFLDRVGAARRLLADRDLTPALADADRALLAGTLQTLGEAASGRDEQLLHGEPHPGNVLMTAGGPLFVDFETCCRGPIEFDLAHAPAEVAGHYPGVDHDLLRACRTLVLAIVTTWRFDRDDEFPDGRRIGAEWLDHLKNQR